MEVLFSDESVKLQDNSIFLAGPTLRNSSFEQSWRKTACNKLEAMGYKGMVYNPEYCHGDNPTDLLQQMPWERELLMNAGCILFYLCRKFPENPGLTTNVEYGTYLSKRLDRCIVCIPHGYDKNRYLEWLYETECKEANIPCIIYRELDAALAAAMDKAVDYSKHSKK